ncbi:MAG: potassium channel family protein [Roseicyclus sp.]|nr:potassium channel family protein [Roseicyclus sp.]MBO6625494.1 potassium channel family protein [Roseicyclus sp.]MBO6921454.1 potassium channel family protein [Roseicyclus sp.]
MTRAGIIQLLDGTHPRDERGVALALNALILLSAIAIAMETMPDLPQPVTRLLGWFEIAVLAIFALEYITRILCSPRPLRYVFSFWGLIDLLAILPLLAILQPQWTAVRILRLVRLIRLLKLFRTSRALDRMARAFHAVKGELTVFGVLAAMMLYVSAVGIYVFEHPAQPEAFTSIPMSLWWAVASLTTVGYGDLVPITLGGRLFTTLVLFIGLGIVAGPAAIITTALLEADKYEAGPSTPTETENTSNKETKE